MPKIVFSSDQLPAHLSNEARAAAWLGRLNAAWRLLTSVRHAHRKVIDIALSSGFNDVSYFHRSFRARFGMTPSDARAAAAWPI